MHYVPRSCLAILLVWSALHGGTGWATDLPVCQESVAVTSAAVSQVAPGIYLRNSHPGEIFTDHEIANTGFIIGEQVVAVIDSGGSYAEGLALSCAIQQLTDLPIKYVINTHVHPDHILGNAAFRQPGVEFVGHSHLKRAMLLLGETYLRRAGASGDTVTEKAGMVYPDREVSDTLELDLGGRTLRLQAMPPAHTDNDLIVVDSKTGTYWLADLLFHDHIPVMGGSGNVNGWIKLLDDWLAEDNTLQPPLQRVIAGHGLPTQTLPELQAALTAERDYLVDMRAAVRLWIEEGKGLAAALDNIGQAEAARWPMAASFHKRNISYLYAELEWE